MMGSEKKKQKQPPQVVHGPQTNIDGDVHGPVLSGVFNAPVILKSFVEDKIFRRLGIEQRMGFALLAIIVIAVGIGVVASLYLALHPGQPKHMTGDFHIAVAGFAECGNSRSYEIGMQVGRDVSERLRREFDDMDLDFVVTVWGPDRVGSVKGNSRQDRASSAERIAERIAADIVVYGAIDSGSTRRWEVLPEFYVNVENFHQAAEVLGQHEIGKPFSVVQSGGPATRLELNTELALRTGIIFRIE